MAAYDGLVVGYLREVLVQLHLVVHHRTNLQQVEVTRPVGVELHRELNLHLAAHVLPSIFHGEGEQLRKREDPVLQHATESDDLSSSFVDAVADDLVIGVEGRGDILQRPVLVCFPDGQFQQVEAVVHGEVLRHVLQVEGIEAGLRLFQRDVHLRGLQHLVGMSRTDPQVETAVHDVLAQAECQVDGALLCFLVADGIVVDASCHTGDVRIETVAVLRADHLLQDHSHLLLVYHVRRRKHIVLAGLIEHGGIDPLDGIAEHLKPLVLVLTVGNHIRAVNPGKRLIMRIFKQRRRAYGYRLLHHLKEGVEVLGQGFRQTGVEEVMEHLLVGDVIAEHNLVKLVTGHELVEDVGAEHDGLRNHHPRVVEAVEVDMAFDDVVDEGDATAFASERTLSDSREVGVLVKAVAMEHGHHALVLHLAVAHDGVEDDVTVGVDVLKGMPGDALEKVGYGEEGTRAQPARHVVVGDMIEQRLLGQGEDIVLKVLEVLDPSHLLHRVRVAEDEVAESEIASDEVLQLHVHVLRVLVDERGSALTRQLHAVGLRRLHDERNVLVGLTDFRQQLEAGQVVLHPVLRESAVADDAKHVVLVFLIQFPGLLIATGEHDLWPSAHTQRLQLRVQSLRGKEQALLQHEVVERGEDG